MRIIACFILVCLSLLFEKECVCNYIKLCLIIYVLPPSIKTEVKRCGVLPFTLIIVANWFVVLPFTFFVAAKRSDVVPFTTLVRAKRFSDVAFTVVAEGFRCVPLPRR